MNHVLDGTHEVRILDSLRPIFPQLSDHVLTNCIRNVGEIVGSDPTSIIPGCIDALLAGTFVEQQPNSRTREVTTISDNQEDDIICLSPSTSAPRHVKGPFIVDDCDELPSSLNVSQSSTSPVPARGSLPLSSNSTVASGVEIYVNLEGGDLHAREESKVEHCRSSSVTTNSHTCTLPHVHVPQAITELPKSHAVDPMAEALRDVLTLFPDAEDDYVRSLIAKWSSVPLNMAVNHVCNELLENSGYPKKAAKQSSKYQMPTEEPKQKDYWKEYGNPTSIAYKEQCLVLLLNEFRTVPMKHIYETLANFNYHYAPSKRYLDHLVMGSSCAYTVVGNGTNLKSQYTKGNKKATSPAKIRLNKCERSERKLPSVLDYELQKEVDFVKKFERSRAVESDRIVAVTLNDKQYEEEGQKIECACCYGDVAFEDMVQCLEGHLFCASCLMNYAKEAVFGQGKATLTCMSGDCDGTFPMSQLQKALPSNILKKYEDRVQEESLSLAQMEGFVRCTSCDFAAIMPPDDKVFKCQNPSCAKEICRYCKEDWSDHFGLKCKEVEKSAQKDVRLSYEERMTMAKIRKCAKCGCEFTKADGCNKMTCRCGATMCYVCRKPGINYKHFCQHPRDPGKKCHKCNTCSLWSDPTEDDNRAVKELEKEAVEAKRKLEAVDETSTSETPAKKIKHNKTSE